MVRGNIFKFKIKTRRRVPWERRDRSGGIAAGRNGFYLFARRYYRPELFFIPDRGRRGGERRRNRSRLALISSVAISLDPTPSGPSRKRRRERADLPFSSSPFAIFFSLSLVLHLRLLSRGSPLSALPGRRGLGRTEIIRRTTM